jgi:hypothetical protein
MAGPKGSEEFFAFSLLRSTTIMPSQRFRRETVMALLVLTLCAGAPGLARGDFIIALDPAGAYLRVNGESPPDAVPIDLLSLGFVPGDTIMLTRLGDYQRSSFAPFNMDDSLDTTGVFSSSSVLGPPGDLHRVLGAVSAGLDFMTVNAFLGDLLTDIPQDFEISNFDGTITSVTLQVPAGARFLFIATADSLFFDNTDPDGDFGVRITRVIPEPSSIVLAIVGLLGLLVVVWRQRTASSETHK